MPVPIGPDMSSKTGLIVGWIVLAIVVTIMLIKGFKRK